jgi:DNA-binding XRE family transcriptional regulator
MAKKFAELKSQVMARPGAAERQAALRDQSHQELGLYQLRVEREFTQVALAELLDVQQPGISRIEHADDIRISTLRDYLAAMGAELRIEAVFEDGHVYPLALGASPKPAIR